ncbi:MAG: T9SS type A sorting domain-containing protein [Bacteroidales bacterium]|jgi:hypothetical protein|nr:T9SS type A sorting domain-containing protein [Bacteroidales bacterium]
MKKIFSTIIISLNCLVSFSQTFEWKRLSDDIVDSVYQQAVFTTNDIVLKNQNYYFAYTIFPYESEWGGSSVFRAGYLYPTILSQDNQVIMADTLYLDSIFFSQNIATTFIQNDTFRVIINYPVLDSATYCNNTILRKGIPAPKCKGFLMINYSLTGGFLGYDSLALPPAVEHLANLSEAASNCALFIKDLLVNSQQEVFIHLGYNLRSGSAGVFPLDTASFIVKYNSDLSVSNKVIPVLLKSKDSDFPMSLKIFNENLYLLGSISDSVIVDNMLFISDTTAGYKTFAVEFDRNLYSLKSKTLPGSYYSFIVDQNNYIYLSGYYNYPLSIDGRVIIPTIYADPDTFYVSDAIIMKLKPDWTIENYINILDGCGSPKMYSNGERIFMKDLRNCGQLLLQNGDTIDNPVSSQTGCNNLILINNSTLIPFWDYNFPLDNNVMNIYFNSDNMLLNFSAYYYYLAGFGDTDTLFLSGYYYPVVLAQISITGLGLEEMSGSEAAPLVVYPNPVSDQLFVKLPENDDFIVSVFDLNGKLHIRKQLSGSENSLNVSGLNPGLYIVHAQNEKQILTGKFLKE